MHPPFSRPEQCHGTGNGQDTVNHGQLCLHEPFQCLGYVDDDLQEILGVDVSPANGPNTFFGFEGKDWKEWRTPWGQDVLVPGQFNVTTSPEGDTYIYPEGDLTAPASGHMPASGYFFDAIIRQPPLPLDDADLKVEKLYDAVGDRIGAIFICGTDFGTQDSTFCSPETYKSLYHPHYRRLNDWIHANTGWKTFKHSCGSVPAFMPLFIESGFDIINPVQTSAKGMDPTWLKREYGKDLTFWGGGMETQQVLPFGTPEEVRAETLMKCEIFGKDGGFVFNTIHNTQARTPVENMVAMIDALKEFNGK